MVNGGVGAGPEGSCSQGRKAFWQPVVKAIVVRAAYEDFHH